LFEVIHVAAVVVFFFFFWFSTLLLMQQPGWMEPSGLTQILQYDSRPSSEFLAKILGVKHFTFCLEYAVLFYTFFPITLYVLRRTGSFVDCSSLMGSLLVAQLIDVWFPKCIYF
jgi:hypothetical protein